MGLFDSIAGAVIGQLGGEQGSMAQVAMNLFNEHGGLNGILEKFKDSGLGEQVGSWVGTGQNLPVSAEQIQQVLGSDAVASMAQKFGISSDEISSKLAEYLPTVVDKLTPDGEVPENQSGLLTQVLSMLKS